jgi:hypothetical protein
MSEKTVEYRCPAKPNLGMGNGIKFKAGVFRTANATQQRQVENSATFKSGFISKDGVLPESAGVKHLVDWVRSHAIQPEDKYEKAQPSVRVGMVGTADAVERMVEPEAEAVPEPEATATEIPAVPSKTRISRMNKAERIALAKEWSGLAPELVGVSDEMRSVDIERMLNEHLMPFRE